MDKRHRGCCTAMENASRADFEALVDFEREYNGGLVERLVAQLELLDEEWTPYPINRYQHSLQSATRAYRERADDRVA